MKCFTRFLSFTLISLLIFINIYAILNFQYFWTFLFLFYLTHFIFLCQLSPNTIPHICLLGSDSWSQQATPKSHFRCHSNEMVELKLKQRKHPISIEITLTNYFNNACKRSGSLSSRQYGIQKLHLFYCTNFESAYTFPKMSFCF